MEVTTKKGTVISDELFDKMAKAYEEGTWKGKVVERGVGRPRLSAEESKLIAFRLPVSMIEALDRKAKESGESRSERLRDVVARDLMEA
ncbi:MAG: ribbon-helix-helix protein, CopG family [Raoultibacter sp.]